MDTWELMEGPLMTPRRSPEQRMDEALDQMAHDLVTIEDCLKLGVKLGERRNTLNAFVAKLNRILARPS